MLSPQFRKVNWIIIRAVALTSKIPKNEYRAGFDIKASPFESLTYGDCAKCLLDAIDDTKWTIAIVYLKKK